ncbi:tetratricopeptide repeat protein [candidate division KSB1 bacterium]
MRRKAAASFRSLFPVFVLLFASSLSSQTDIAEGKNHFQQKKYSQAEKIFKSIIDNDSKNAEAHFYLGRIYFIQGNYEDAVKAHENAVKVNENNPEYQFYLGQSYTRRIGEVNMFSQMRMAGKMKKAYEKAVELAPNDPEKKFGLMMWYAEAPGIAGGSMEKAETFAQEINELDALWGSRAFLEIYKKNGDTEKTIQTSNEILQHDPDNEDIYISLTNTYIQQKQYDEAFALYSNLIERNPDKVFAYYQVGKLASVSGKNLDDGENALRKYLEMERRPDDPSEAWAHYRLGTIFEHRSDLANAQKEFETALKLEENHEEAKKALKRIKK